MSNGLELRRTGGIDESGCETGNRNGWFVSRKFSPVA
jgi:hypothetical protein